LVWYSFHKIKGFLPSDIGITLNPEFSKLIALPNVTFIFVFYKVLKKEGGGGVFLAVLSKKVYTSLHLVYT
jgi:hypothetical protein